MAYLRFTVSTRHPHSGVADGVFRTAYKLRNSSISKEDRETLAEQLAWFAENLEIPTRFNRSSSKGYHRRNTKGIAWFRDEALEHIARMFAIKRVLEANGHQVHIVREDRIGYAVYRDAVQVIAEPFADTRTGP